MISQKLLLESAEIVGRVRDLNAVPGSAGTADMIAVADKAGVPVIKVGWSENG